MFGFFRRTHYQPPPPPALTPRQQHDLLRLLSAIGLEILRESKGPMPLLVFGRRVAERLDVPPPVPLCHFSDALKLLIRQMDHERLRVMSPTDFLGVGYVYNAADPETWPFRSGR